MKKILILLVLTSLFLFSCSLVNDEKKESSSLPENLIIEDDNSKSNENNLSINSPVSSKLQLYEGRYFDSKVYTEGPKLTHYFEVIISNITETSFDFSFYEVDKYTNEKKIIFHTNTAIFIEDGTFAAFYGKDYTLNFTFPDGHESHPVVTDMKISGFPPLEGLTFLNNGIPGHEFG